MTVIGADKYDVKAYPFSALARKSVLVNYGDYWFYRSDELLSPPNFKNIFIAPYKTLSSNIKIQDEVEIPEI